MSGNSCNAVFVQCVAHQDPSKRHSSSWLQPALAIALVACFAVDRGPVQNFTLAVTLIAYQNLTGSPTRVALLLENSGAIEVPATAVAIRALHSHPRESRINGRNWVNAPLIGRTASRQSLPRQR